jgi:CBS domain-containing protein
MPQSIREVMTADPVSLSATTSLTDAARRMRDEDIGDVLVSDGDRLRGVVTDRDIVVRAVAEGRDITSTTLADVCSTDVITVGPSDSVDDAVRMMSEHAVRRIPVVENGRPVGIVSIGDVAIERQPNSALADISAAPPTS